MKNSLTWLHLSDLHARTRDDWDSRQITDALVRDLKTMQKEYGLRPDLIFFTGDLVFGAFPGDSMSDQYELVRKFLEAVRTAFDPEIPIRNLYLVPGNHDTDRGEITPDQTDWLRHPDRNLSEIIGAIRDSKKQWRMWMDRLTNYRNFLTSYGLIHLTPEDSHLIWADAIEIPGARVGIAGLNSAWSCANDEDKGKLWFGFDWQIAQVKQRMGPVDFAFALVHHPSNWFTGHEDPKALHRLRQEFAIVLHGHEHQDWVESDADGRLVLSAGACYESSWMTNGYSFGQINLTQQLGNIRLRQWDSIGRGWVPRNIANKTKDDVWPLPSLPWVKSSSIEHAVDSDEPVNALQTSVPGPCESAEEHYTKLYCQYVINQYDVLELFGCDIPRELQRHTLSVAYVSLNLAQEDEIGNSNDPLEPIQDHLNTPDSLHDNEKIPAEYDEGSSTEFEYILDNISERGGRLLINGPAGAGKSTLLRWCSIYAARQIINESPSPERRFHLPKITKDIPDRDRNCKDISLDVRDDWRQKIPLLIRLRDCPSGHLPAANNLPEFLAKHLPSAPSNWITNVLSSGQALILFDGVDEIHRDQRSKLAEEIGELIRTYPNCTYVITTRPGAVEPGWLARLDFIEARVEPMSRRAREEFIDKWYRSAALELKSRPRLGENLTLTASRLNSELADQPELGNLATNPLLCAMICALYRERQEKLPETPAELSEALCHMLLHRRERETPGLDGQHFHATWRALQYAQKKGLLAELAWNMVSRGESSIEIIAAKKLVADGLHSTPGRNKDEATDVVQALIERSGLLRPSDDDRIDFLHNTLKEYLAAGRVVETGEWTALASHADDPAWQPVILFALALAPEPFSSGLVKQLLSQINSNKISTKKTSSLSKQERKTLAASKSRQFFLVRCRASAKRLSADLSTTIDAFIKHLLPPASMNEAEALAQLGPRILLYGTESLGKPGWWNAQNCQMVTRCLRLLRLIGGIRAKTLLKAIRKLPTHSSQVNNEWLLSCCELSPEEKLPWPFQIEKLTQFSLSSPSIRDISRLNDLTSLRYLELSGTAVTSLDSLRNLKLLQSLGLSRTDVNEIGPVEEFTSLQRLNLGGTQVSDLAPLAGLTTLTHLYCWHTLVTNLAPLAGLTSLEELRLWGSPIASLDALSSLILLQTLDLERTKVTDLSPLAGLIALQQLDLDETQVASLTPLSGLNSLKHLKLANTKVTDLSPLAGLTKLTNLTLNRTQIADISPLAKLLSLKILSLTGTLVTDLTPLIGLTDLEFLSLNRTQVADISQLAELFSLRTLNLTDTLVTDLSPLVNIASLNYVRLGKTSAISAQALAAFKGQRPDIKFI